MAEVAMAEVSLAKAATSRPNLLKAHKSRTATHKHNMKMMNSSIKSGKQAL